MKIRHMSQWPSTPVQNSHLTQGNHFGFSSRWQSKTKQEVFCFSMEMSSCFSNRKCISVSYSLTLELFRIVFRWQFDSFIIYYWTNYLRTSIRLCFLYSMYCKFCVIRFLVGISCTPVSILNSIGTIGIRAVFGEFEDENLSICFFSNS